MARLEQVNSASLAKPGMYLSHASRKKIVMQRIKISPFISKLNY
ncbi:MAG: hypothetical protein RIE73_13695 [Coleofasciculus sp. C1-SOL-03]